jgi:hypothetical protein
MILLILAVRSFDTSLKRPQAAALAGPAPCRFAHGAGPS